MYKLLQKFLLSIFLLCVLVLTKEMSLQAANNNIHIRDNAFILTEEEEVQLEVHLEDSLPYAGDIYVFTTYSIENDLNDYMNALVCNQTIMEYNTEAWFRKYSSKDKSAIVFHIDVVHNKIYFADYTRSYKGDAYAEIIMSNVYPYFRDGKYYECIYNAFSQYQSMNEGKHVFQPTKYIANAMIAFSVSICVMFIIMRSTSIIKVQTEDERRQTTYKRVAISNPHALRKDTFYRKINNN